jgi:hypothetical protein
VAQLWFAETTRAREEVQWVYKLGAMLVRADVAVDASRRAKLLGR